MNERRTTGLHTRAAYLCVAGPTASGKTAAAIEIARRWPVEIVSVDSALVYRGLDIGSAKPSAEEQGVAPHHLIDIREPDDPYSAADFVRDAKQLIEEIGARGRTPLLVGGTMLYFKALIEGLDDLPAATPAVRARLEAQAARLGWPAMHDRLSQVDAATAARLAPNDAQRIQRALEVWEVSGRPLSSFFSKKPAVVLPPLLSLEPMDRGWLHRRIAERFGAMLDAGFLDEVRALRAQGLDPDLPALRAVGYRQAWAALDGVEFNGQPADEAKLRALLMDTGVAATRQLAKRQITWLRSMSWRDLVPGDAPDALPRVLDWARNHLGPEQAH